MRLIKFCITISCIVGSNLITFSQEVKAPCTYQPPTITCEQAQKNADAIVKYPVSLKSLSEKDTIIKTKEHEVSMLKNGFTEERKEFNFKIDGLKQDNNVLATQLDTQIGRKKKWRLVAGVAFLVVILDRFAKK